MYHGVPVVGVPLFGDHYDTMTRVAAKGMGIMLHWKYMTEDDLFAALSSVIKDTRSDYFKSEFTDGHFVPRESFAVPPSGQTLYDFRGTQIFSPICLFFNLGIASKHIFFPAFTKTSLATL